MRQGVVMAGRTATILLRNRLTLGILLGSPLGILAMFLMLFRAAPSTRPRRARAPA